MDGSELRVSPDGNDLSTYGGSKKGGKRHYFHANMLYDVLNHTCVDMVLQPGSEKNEDSAFLDLAERVEDPNVIYTCERIRMPHDISPARSIRKTLRHSNQR
ncbi:hypothetical protein [Allobaculum mucilyticum]|uniref:hypothetical protein n=1 Tax=Allobaculum mucilyticum TaxID=2834459 RepID=UPI001F62099C|nr:hypothetical protein [Allobaculum mucilyticum]UNT96588.1 hypothetical protein KWG62_02165 [Allobaculum mucilyticum]